MATVVRSGWRAQGNVYVTQFFISGQRGPGGHVADIFGRTFAPGFIARLSFSGHNVECPEQRATVDVIAAQILGLGASIESAVSITARRSAAAVSTNNNHVIYDERARPSEIGRVVRRFAFQRNSSVFAKVSLRCASLGVQSIQILAAYGNDALL